MPLSACSPGRGDGLSQEGTFTVAVMPAELTLEARGTAAVTVAIARLDGFADAVEVSATLPAGISADSLVIPPSQSSGQLVLRSAGTEAATRVPVTVTATSATHTSTAAFALILVGNASPRLALTPATAAVFVGERTSLTPVFDGDRASIDGRARPERRFPRHHVYAAGRPRQCAGAGTDHGAGELPQSDSRAGQRSGRADQPRCCRAARRNRDRDGRKYFGVVLCARQHADADLRSCDGEVRARTRSNVLRPGAAVHLRRAAGERRLPAGGQRPQRAGGRASFRGHTAVRSCRAGTHAGWRRGDAGHLHSDGDAALRRRCAADRRACRRDEPGHR